MNFRSSLACTSSDIARWGLRSVLKRQGGVLPGRIAMKIGPELLSDLASLVDRSVVITGECGEYQGYAVIEPSLTDVRISTDGFGDATGTITGTIVVALDRSALDVDVDVRADVDLVTHLAITCAPGGLCQPEPGSWLELAALGRVDVIGAWRPEPAGGFLTLIGLQTLTLDFNAGGDCTPYTLDGLPAGCL